MCRFLLASFPADADLKELTESIPERLRESLLRGGLCDSWPDHTHFEFRRVESKLALPYEDEQLVTCTQVHCDCWSTLATEQPNRKEVTRWRTIFDSIHNVVPRFGFVIHFGDPSDEFALAGPEPLPMSEADPLHRMREDTYYDVTP